MSTPSPPRRAPGGVALGCWIAGALTAIGSLVIGITMASSRSSLAIVVVPLYASLAFAPIFAVGLVIGLVAILRARETLGVAASVLNAISLAPALTLVATVLPMLPRE